MTNNQILNLRTELFKAKIIPSLQYDLELIKGYQKYELLVLKEQSLDKVAYQDFSDQEMMMHFKDWFFEDRNSFVIFYLNSDKFLVFHTGTELYNYLENHWDQDCDYIYSQDFQKIVLFHHEKAYWKNF